MNCGRNKVDGDHWLGAFNYCDLYVCAEMVHSRMETRFVMCMVGDALCVFFIGGSCFTGRHQKTHSFIYVWRMNDEQRKLN